MSYNAPFYLTEKEGNNVFAYEGRIPEARLWVPALMEGSLEDVRPGEEVVFADWDEFEVLQKCKGLKAFVKTHFEGVPTVIVDNHNHVFYFWYEALEQGILKRGASLVHVDQHKDARVPEVLFEGGSLEEVFAYTNKQLNVGNYIVPAQREGLLGEIQFVTSEMALEEKTLMHDSNKILNIDLDFFAPEMDYISFEKAKRFILDHAKNAALITVATSPFFIDQARAIAVLKDLLQTKRAP